MELIGLMCGSFCALFTTVYSFVYVKYINKEMSRQDSFFIMFCFLCSIGLMTYLIYTQQ